MNGRLTGLILLLGASACTCQPAPTSCQIGDTLYPGGTQNPDNPCETCVPSQNTTGWTYTSDAGACATDGGPPDAGPLDGGPLDGGLLDGGPLDAGDASVPSCLIDGGDFPDHWQNPDNPCQTCQPDVSPTAWSNRVDGIACTGGACVGGVCEPGCILAGVFYSAGALDPNNGCQVCQSVGGSSSWDPLTGLPAQSACPTGDICNLGACVPGCFIAGTVASAGAPEPGDACQTCQPVTSISAWSPFTGVPLGGCDGGQFCMQGTCSPEPICLIDGGVIPNRAYKPGDTGLCCNALTKKLGWTPSFANAGNFAAGSPYALVAGDFNVDGLPDLVLASGSGSLTLSLNQGQAQFSTVTQSTNFYVGTLQVGDFNGDGRPDIAVGGAGKVGVLLNLDAGFSETDSTLSGGAGRLIAVDVDGDGHLDLVATNGSTSVSVFLGDGLGGLSAEATYTTGGSSSCFVVAGLFDSDSFPDLVVNQCGSDAALLLNDGTGKFPSSAALPGVSTTWALAAGHFQSPDLWDLAVGSELNPQTTVFSNPADGGFSAPATYVTIPPADFAVGDLNGDGFDDLVAIGWYGKTFQLLINQGDGTFLPGAEFVASTTDTMQCLAVADFNGDGALDIAVVPSNAASGEIWLNGCP